MARKGLAEGPASWCNIFRDDGAAVAGGDLEGEALSIEKRVALPILTPVSGHWLPIGS